MHLALEGQGPLPFEHFLGRLCEEFHCLPSVAYREWLEAPAGLLETIIEYRAYRQAKAAFETSPKTAGDSPLVQLAKEITFDLVQEEIVGR